MALYKLFKNPQTGETNTVLKTDDSTKTVSIPFDEGNTDYQEYLKWVADGGVAEPAE